MSKKVSVIVPAYNSEKYIKESIESILNQTYKNLELILINDFSTDQTYEIMQKYQELDNRIIIVNNINKGLINALNLGLSIAKGDYIARLDSDDIAHIQRFEKQVKFLEENANYFLVCSDMRIINSEGHVILNNVHLNNKLSPPYEWMLLWGNPIAQSSVLFKNSDKYKYPNEFAEDYAFWLQVALENRIYHFDEVLIDYRVHFSSYSQLNTSKSYHSALSLSKKYFSNLIKEDDNIFEKFIQFYYLLNNKIIKNISYKDFKIISEKTIQVISSKFNYSKEENKRCKNYLYFIYLKYLVNTKQWYKILIFILRYFYVIEFLKIIYSNFRVSYNLKKMKMASSYKES